LVLKKNSLKELYKQRGDTTKRSSWSKIPRVSIKIAVREDRKPSVCYEWWRKK